MGLTKAERERRETVKAVDRMFTSVQHYYVRAGRQPVATVIVGIRRGSKRLCRGVAICSTVENFNRQEGQYLAKRRLVEAARTRQCSERIYMSFEREVRGTKVGAPAKAVDRFVKACVKGFGTCPTVWKSGYNVVLTAQEKKILAV